MAERQPDSGDAARKQTVTKEIKSSPSSSTGKGDSSSEKIFTLLLAG